MTESLRGDLPAHVHAGLVIPGWVHTAIGPDAVMRNGMDVARFAELIVPQMLARQRFVVAHAYNVVRMHERIDALCRSFAADWEQGRPDLNAYLSRAAPGDRGPPDATDGRI